MGRCTKCGESKPPEAFSKDSRARDGIRVWCRACCSAYSKKHYRDNPKSEEQKSIARERTLRWIKENPGRHQANADAYKNRHPVKAEAWNKVTNAIRLGHLIPPHAQRRVVLESDYDALAADHRGAIADVQRLQSSLEILAERIERDRREPDKVLCYVLDMRRAAAPRGQ